MTEQPKTKWYENLISSINNLAEEFGLDDPQAQRFRDFMIGIARDQYKSGNRSGIRWAHEQIRTQQAAA